MLQKLQTPIHYVVRSGHTDSDRSISMNKTFPIIEI